MAAPPRPAYMESADYPSAEHSSQPEGARAPFGVSGADGAEPRGRAELDQHRRDRDPTGLVLEVLHDRQHRARRRRGAVEGVDARGAFAAGPVADLEAVCLVVGRVRAGGDLAVALLGREPRFDVELARGRRAEVANRDVDDAVREAELADQLLLDREQALVLGARLLGRDQDE